jgi:hypothetical protein
MLVKLDAVFEGALGTTLVVAAATGGLEDSDFPRPVGAALLVVIGLALVLLGVAIWTGRIGLRELALGNAVSALAGVVFLLAVSGFSSAGTALVAIVVACLASLAAAQALSLRA